MPSNRARVILSTLVSLIVGLAGGVAFAGTVVGPVEKDTVGIFQATSTFLIGNSNAANAVLTAVSFGPAGALPVMGDFDGNGTTTVGVYSPTLGEFFQRNSNTEGTAQTRFRFGSTNSTYAPIVGNWNGAGGASIGLYNAVAGKFLLRNTNSGGLPDLETPFGPKNASPALIPIVGNWSGVGTTDGIGLYDPATGQFLLKNNPATGGPADFSFRFGAGGLGYLPVVGNWNNDTTDTIGLYDPATKTFFLRNTNSSGNADTVFKLGPQAVSNKPVAGNFDGN